MTNQPESTRIRNLTQDIEMCFYDHPGQRYSPPAVIQARLYESDKGTISAVLSYPQGIGIMPWNFWEIYCTQGDLMEDVERFDKEEDMENRVTELLG